MKVLKLMKRAPTKLLNGPKKGNARARNHSSAATGKRITTLKGNQAVWMPHSFSHMKNNGIT